MLSTAHTYTALIHSQYGPTQRVEAEVAGTAEQTAHAAVDVHCDELRDELPHHKAESAIDDLTIVELLDERGAKLYSGAVQREAFDNVLA